MQLCYYGANNLYYLILIQLQVFGVLNEDFEAWPIATMSENLKKHLLLVSIQSSQGFHAL